MVKIISELKMFNLIKGSSVIERDRYVDADVDWRRAGGQVSIFDGDSGIIITSSGTTGELYDDGSVIVSRDGLFKAEDNADEGYDIFEDPRVFSMRKRLKTLGKMEFQVQKVLPGCLEKIRRYTKVLLEALLAELHLQTACFELERAVVSTTININCRVQTDNTNLKIFHISEGRIKSFYTVSFCLKLQDDDGSRLYFSQGERVLLTAAQNQIVTIQSCLDNLQGLISSYSVENAVAALEDFMARGVSSSFYDRLQACLVIPDLWATAGHTGCGGIKDN